jgi:hypothetical protein
MLVKKSVSLIEIESPNGNGGVYELGARVCIGNDLRSNFERGARQRVFDNHFSIALVHLVSQADLTTPRLYWQDNARCEMDQHKRKKVRLDYTTHLNQTRASSRTISAGQLLSR